MDVVDGNLRPNTGRASHLPRKRRQASRDIQSRGTSRRGNIHTANRGIVRRQVNGVGHSPGHRITRVHNPQTMSQVVVLRNSRIGNPQTRSRGRGVSAVIRDVDNAGSGRPNPIRRAT